MKIKSKSIQWMKSRNCDVIIKREETSPSFKSVRFPKLQILVEMSRRNLQSQVWKRRNQEISIYFSLNAIVAAITLKFKMRRFPNEAH